jgi:hypothetical protein
MIPKRPSNKILNKLKETYKCVPSTGIITRKSDGLPVGHKNEYGYITLSIRIPANNKAGSEWKKISVHHAIWYFHTGEWPIDMIDHIDGQKDNNRIDNLRTCSQSENNMNTNARSGYKGVSWDKSTNSWTSVIHKDYKQYWIGRFETAEEAALAYNKKAQEIYGEFARLNDVDVAPKSLNEIVPLIEKYGVKDILFAIKLLSIDSRIRKNLASHLKQ